MDEFINLIIFGVLILLSTLFGRKKKRAGRGSSQAPSVPRPRREITSTDTKPSSEQARHVARAERPGLEPGQQPGSFREFFELLQQQAETVSQDEPWAPEEAPESPFPPTALVRGERAPPQTLETLEAAGGKSHDRFHDRYIRPLDAPPVRLPPDFVLPRDPVSLKRAVIWSEILGKPKGLT